MTWARCCIAAVSLAVLASCGSDCSDGEHVCKGNQLELCGPPGDITGSQHFIAGLDCAADHCVQFQVDGLRQASCSATGSPDSRCHAQGPTCLDDHTFGVCDDGFSSRLQACTGTCTTHGSAAGCEP